MGINNKIFERLCEEDEKITIEETLRKALITEMKIMSTKKWTIVMSTTSKATR